MSRLIAAFLLVLGLGGCAEPPYTNLDNEQLKRLLSQGVPLYDIRRPEEWRETGVVAGSRLMTFFDARGGVSPRFLPRFTEAIDRDQPVILICRTGNRTDALARYLVEKLGYTQVYNVRRGISHWIREDNPVVAN
jgi:rhodanese-related sulfurtransferase